MSVDAFSFDPEEPVGAFELIYEPEEPYKWVVPDLLEAQDRLIVTGWEGGGKSTFNRQWGFQISSGVHPVTLAPIEPKRVYILDVENGRRLLRRECRKIVDRAGLTVESNPLLIIQNKPKGINLRDTTEVLELQQDLTDFNPDLFICGPLYKMGITDPVSEVMAQEVQGVLDVLRTTFDMALQIEAHSPLGTDINDKRTIRPIGSSAWLRWPEFGYHLSNVGQWTEWRGPRDADRAFPTRFYRDVEASPWPWSPVSKVELTADNMISAMRSLCTRGVKVTKRAVERETGTSHATFTRFVNQNAALWDSTLENLDKSSFGPLVHE